MTSITPFVAGHNKVGGLIRLVAKTIDKHALTASVLIGVAACLLYVLAETAFDYVPGDVPRLYVSYTGDITVATLPEAAVAPVGGLMLFLGGVAFGIFIVERHRPTGRMGVDK